MSAVDFQSSTGAEVHVAYLPTYLRTLSRPRGGCSGLGTADTLSLLSVWDASLCMKCRVGLGPCVGEAEFGSVFLFCVKHLRRTNQGGGWSPSSLLSASVNQFKSSEWALGSSQIWL